MIEWRILISHIIQINFIYLIPFIATPDSFCQKILTCESIFNFLEKKEAIQRDFSFHTSFDYLAGVAERDLVSRVRTETWNCICKQAH